MLHWRTEPNYPLNVRVDKALLKSYSCKIRILVFSANQKLCFSKTVVYWTFTQLGQRGMWKLDGTIFYGLTLNSEWPPKFPPMHTWKIYLEVHSIFVDLVQQFKMSTHLQQCVSQNSRLGLFHLNWENPKVTEAPAYEACDCTCTPLHTPKIS